MIFLTYIADGKRSSVPRTDFPVPLFLQTSKFCLFWRWCPFFLCCPFTCELFGVQYVNNRKGNPMTWCCFHSGLLIFKHFANSSSISDILFLYSLTKVDAASRRIGGASVRCQWMKVCLSSLTGPLEETREHERLTGSLSIGWEQSVLKPALISINTI